MKRFLSLAMTLVMLLGLTIPQTAFAAGENWFVEVTITDLDNSRSVTNDPTYYSSLEGKLSEKVYEAVRDGYDKLHSAFGGTNYWNGIINEGISAYNSGDLAWEAFIQYYFRDINNAYKQSEYYKDNLVFETVLSNRNSTLNSLLAAESSKGKGIIVGYLRSPEDFGGVVTDHTYEVRIAIRDANEYHPVDLVVVYREKTVVAEMNQGALTLGENNSNPIVIADASGSLPLLNGEKSKPSLAQPAVYAAANGVEIATKYFRSYLDGEDVYFKLDDGGNLVVSSDKAGEEVQFVFSEYTILDLFRDRNLTDPIEKIEEIRKAETIYALVEGTGTVPTPPKQCYLTFILDDEGGMNYTVGSFNEGVTINTNDYSTFYIGDKKYEVTPEKQSVTMNGDQEVHCSTKKDTPVAPVVEDLYVLSYQDVLNGSLGTSYILYGPDKAKTYTLNSTPDADKYPSGYTFGGWYYDSTLSEKITDRNITVDADMEIYAKWTKEGGGGGGGGGTTSYTLTFDVGTGGQVQNQKGEVLSKNSITVSSGTTVNLLDYTASKDGYTFNGWYADAALTKPVVSIKMDSSKTVYAKWTKTVVVTAPIPSMLNGEDHYAYLVGYLDNGIHPKGNITRAEVATIFFRLLKDDVRDANYVKTNSFNDVKEGDWYNNAVSTMAKLNIVNGYADGGFHPNNYITRAEFAAIVSRFDALTNTASAGFTDVAGHWAEANINQAANNGWVNGYQDGTFGPNRVITRSETVTLVNRVLHRLPATTSDLLDDMKRWPDNNDPTAWYYIAMQEATNSHLYEARDNGSEKWIALTPDRDWLALER